MYRTCCIEVFDSIDQTVTQDAKNKETTSMCHFCHAVPAPATVLPNQRQANNKHAYISRAPRLTGDNYENYYTLCSGCTS